MREPGTRPEVILSDVSQIETGGVGRGTTSRPPEAGDDILLDTADFSLVMGGPLFQLMRRAHLSDDSLHLVLQRVVFLALLAWLPLMLLSALEGHLLGGVAVPFFLDLDVHIRFLAVVPLLIVAEVVVHRR